MVLALLGFSSFIMRAGEQVGSFRVDVLPVLTKAGCNAGTCHGAATGQGGFKLSLLGYDPNEDYLRITREWGGRRVDLSRPESSMFLEKPSGKIEHEGGRKLTKGSDGYRMVRDWIAAGVPEGSATLKVSGIEVHPAESTLSQTNAAFQLEVHANLSDGSKRDVTSLALYSSNDDGLAEVSKSGKVTSRGHGSTSIMIRYGGHVAAARVALPYSKSEGPGTDFVPFNAIDIHVASELKRMGVDASPLSDAETFLRRVWLDLAGRLPEPHQVREFLARRDSPQNRLRVVETLLASTSFTDFWTLKLADLLLLGGKPESAKNSHEWLRSQVLSNVPLDRLARSLLTATGKLNEIGPANFSAIAQDARDLSEHAARMFLGLQIGCARCHAHPSDRWTQLDYHEFAAFFSRIRRDNDAIEVADRGEVDHPKTGKPVRPRPLGRAEYPEVSTGDRRVVVAEWMTHPDNPWFARTFANRIWKHLMGRGLVEPVDDLRPTNPPTHPALLDALAQELVRSGFDLRHLIRWIAGSRTYQLSSQTFGNNRQDDRLYSHALVKPLPAQVWLDCITQVTGVSDSFEGYPPGTRAVQLAGPGVPSTALDVLGRCARKRSCETSALSGGGLAQALHLMNGSSINGKLGGGLLTSLIKRTNREALEELYMISLTRRPDPEEFLHWLALLDSTPDRAKSLEDLLWALLNSREFGMNH